MNRSLWALATLLLTLAACPAVEIGGDGTGGKVDASMSDSAVPDAPVQSNGSGGLLASVGGAAGAGGMPSTGGATGQGGGAGGMPGTGGATGQGGTLTPTETLATTSRFFWGDMDVTAPGFLFAPRDTLTIALDADNNLRYLSWKTLPMVPKTFGNGPTDFPLSGTRPVDLNSRGTPLSFDQVSVVDSPAPTATHFLLRMRIVSTSGGFDLVETTEGTRNGDGWAVTYSEEGTLWNAVISAHASGTLFEGDRAATVPASGQPSLWTGPVYLSAPGFAVSPVDYLTIALDASGQIQSFSFETFAQEATFGTGAYDLPLTGTVTDGEHTATVVDAVTPTPTHFSLHHRVQSQSQQDDYIQGIDGTRKGNTLVVNCFITGTQRNRSIDAIATGTLFPGNPPASDGGLGGAGGGKGQGGAGGSRDAGGMPNTGGATGQGGSTNKCIAAWPMPNWPQSVPDAGAPLPNPQSYDTTAIAGVVVDKVTDLMWQRLQDAKQYSWNDAKAHCSSLALGGHSDWRLPTRIELVSIVDPSADIPGNGPAINKTAFPNTQADIYWTSSPAASPSGYSWGVTFSFGDASSYVPESAYWVRCVRSSANPTNAPSVCYTIESDTAYDVHTKLTWQRTIPPDLYNWSGALQYCAVLSLNGGGWRLPTAQELQTIVDDTRLAPAIDSTAFPNMPSAESQTSSFWTSSPNGGDSGTAWNVVFYGGFTRSAGPVSDLYHVRCVR